MCCHVRGTTQCAECGGRVDLLRGNSGLRGVREVPEKKGRQLGDGVDRFIGVARVTLWDLEPRGVVQLRILENPNK
jgi:hypothetical protein